MIKALFFDIDGTLVSFDTHQIPQSTIEALEVARAKGIKIFISTGRPKYIINNLMALQSRGLIDGYITMNGAYCFVGSEVIYKSPISTKSAWQIANFCRNYNKSSVFVSENEMFAFQPDDMLCKIFYEYLNVPELPLIDFDDISKHEMFQITPFISFDEEKLALANVHDCTGVRWFPAFTDITAVGNSKQNGIDQMIKFFDIKLSETMAFGDGGNDISMLRHAAIGVAMGQADAEIKSAANFVTSSVDDNGIYNALKHFGIL